MLPLIPFFIPVWWISIILVVVVALPWFYWRQGNPTLRLLGFVLSLPIVTGLLALLGFPLSTVMHVPTQALLLLLAVVAIWPWLRARADRLGVDEAQLIEVTMACLAGGIAGAWLWFQIEYHGTHANIHVLDGGGKVFYGGLFTGVLIVVLWAYWRQVSARLLLDCFALPMLVVHIAGRLGCFANGCCYGAPCELPWAIAHHQYHQAQVVAGTVVWQQQPHFRILHERNVLAPLQAPAAQIHGEQLDLRFHPSPLYEAGGVALLLLFLCCWQPRTPGRTALSVLSAYAILRFLVEYTRGDSMVDHFFDLAALSKSQAMSVLLLIICLLLALMWKPSPDRIATHND